MKFLYRLNQIAIDLDNLLKSLYWVVMMLVGGFAMWKLSSIDASLKVLASAAR